MNNLPHSQQIYYTYPPKIVQSISFLIKRKSLKLFRQIFRGTVSNCPLCHQPTNCQDGFLSRSCSWLLVGAHLWHVKNLSLSRSLRLVSVTFFPVLLRLVSRNPLLLLPRLVSETFFLLLLRLVSETFFCFYWDLSRKPFPPLLLRLVSETIF